MKGVRGYPKIWAIGHPRAQDLFLGPVVVSEKVDGSQFSWGVVDGLLKLRSKGVELHEPVTIKQFAPAAATARRLKDEGRLVEGWIYRGESMSSPRHNTITYERVPQNNIVLFDIDVGFEVRFGDPDVLAIQAELLGLESAPVLYAGTLENIETLKVLLETESFLGGTKVEGLVIKNYHQWDDRTGHMLMGKLVSEEFREAHGRSWQVRHPGGPGIIEQIVDTLTTEPRYQKALQHLEESGELLGDARDIGPLMKAVQQDLESEEKEWIQEKLWEWARKKVLRGAAREVPNWYKNLLLERAFSPDSTTEEAGDVSQ